jgi:cobalt-zinc-cadmium efflux system protein
MRYNKYNSKHDFLIEDSFKKRLINKNKLKLSLLITSLVMVLEIVGGWLTNSLALISDAGHMFTHFFSLVIGLGAIIYAEKPSCHHRTFGFYRIEILAALLNSLFLFGVVAWIIIEGINRIIHPLSIMSFQMFAIALIGLVVNLISIWILCGADRKDLNIRGVFFHMMADTLSSVAIIIGAVVMHFTNWNIIDPLLSIGIGLVILVWAWHLFKDSVNILLETAPEGITSDKVADALIKEIPQIKEINDLHIWVIASNMYSMTAHVKLEESKQFEEIKKIIAKIKEIVSNQFGIKHATIEVE